MKAEQNPIRDIAEIRSMMERSSKFLSLSGWSGILAGLISLVGAFVAYQYLAFNPIELQDNTVTSGNMSTDMMKVVMLGLAVFILAMMSAVYHSWQKAKKKGEKLWTPISRQLVMQMTIPLIAGGLLILLLFSKGLIGWIAPFSLIFYGMALYNASKYTYEEVRKLGLIEIALGLIAAYYVEYGLLLWALGFGVAHIVYGIYMHYRYER